MFRPFEHVVPFARTGLPHEKKRADEYVWIKGKGGRVRWVAIESAAQRAAVTQAQSLVSSRDAHLGNPAFGLKRNLRRLDYAMEKFGVTRSQLGVTMHGLRHGNLNDLYEDLAGVPSPVRGGAPNSEVLDREARVAVSERAGHARIRAAAAYLGASAQVRANPTQVEDRERSSTIRSGSMVDDRSAHR